MSERTEHWHDLGFTVRAKANDSGHYVEWKIYTLYNWDGEMRWQRDDSAHSPDPVASLDEAEIYASGSTKWDGCSNWIFRDSANNYCEHTCGRQDMVEIGLLLARVHDLCGAMMPEHCDFDPEPLPSLALVREPGR